MIISAISFLDNSYHFSFFVARISLQSLFPLLGFEYISILCKLGELTSNVIKRFTDKCALNISGNFICVLNLRKLNLNVPIGENELKDGNQITFIYDA